MRVALRSFLPPMLLAVLLAVLLAGSLIAVLRCVCLVRRHHSANARKSEQANCAEDLCDLCHLVSIYTSEPVKEVLRTHFMHALYIHWPFCASKCPYCDFNSHVRDRIDIDLWKTVLFRDMQYEAARPVSAPIGPLKAIFFGGGTPSLMPASLVADLLNEAERLWGFSSDIEITLEANPSSVEAAKFAELALAGVNRVSLGIQSFDDETLKFLGRLHGSDEAKEALATAQKHFARTSFDLIYALPRQTAEQWEQALAYALSLGTEHMSLYQLTIEPQTRFATDVRRGVFDPLEDDPAADLFVMTREMAAHAGLPAYEISNHAQPGAESRHNLTYWRYQDYAGIGPGAHGRRAGKAVLRRKKPENYLASFDKQPHGISEERDLTRAEQASEALLMGLRLTEGIDLSALEARFDIPTKALLNRDKLSLHADLGLLRIEGSKIQVTDAGMVVLDGLLGEIVPDALVNA